MELPSKLEVLGDSMGDWGDLISALAEACIAFHRQQNIDGAVENLVNANSDTLASRSPLCRGAAHTQQICCDQRT